VVRDPRVDKITFTGSTATGRRIASICGERIARVTLELGGKSAAVILDHADIETTDRPHPVRGRVHAVRAGLLVLTRIVVPGPGTTNSSRRWPPRSARCAWATRSAPSRRWGPKDLERGWYIEPTVFGNVDNHSVIAQEEIFGPVLTVIPWQGWVYLFVTWNPSPEGAGGRRPPGLAVSPWYPGD
jgi:aldehyde dehydrogenase (NAD+)